MTHPTVPVSWGEFFDKVAILEIKTRRLRSAQARVNATNELQALRQSTGPPVTAPALEAALLAVNTRLWRIEDLIRESEAAGDFGPRFIALARAVYHENDERGRIKSALNHLLHSALIEEKQYPAY